MSKCLFVFLFVISSFGTFFYMHLWNLKDFSFSFISIVVYIVHSLPILLFCLCFSVSLNIADYTFCILCLSLCLSACLSVCFFIYFFSLFVFLAVCLCFCLYFFLSECLSFSQFFCLYFSLCLGIYLSAYLFSHCTFYML